MAIFEHDPNHSRRDMSSRDARLAYKLATRYVTRHSGPYSECPLCPADREAVVGDILAEWWIADWQVGPEVVDRLRATLYSVCYYARVRRWKLSSVEHREEYHRVTSLPSSGTSVDSRQPNPATLVATAEEIARTRSVMAVGSRQRKNRLRVKCTKGKKLPRRQIFRELIPDGGLFTRTDEGLLVQIATRLRVETSTRYSYKQTGSVPNREQRTTRLRLPEHMPNVGRLDYGPLCYALTGADEDKRERLPTFTREHQPEPLRPLPRTENETTPVKSPVRWNATHTSAERQLIGIDDLTG